MALAGRGVWLSEIALPILAVRLHDLHVFPQRGMKRAFPGEDPMAQARKSRKPSPLLYADSEHNAEQLYFGGVFVPDPFISFAIGNRRYAVVSALEFARLKAASKFDEILSLEAWIDRARKGFPGRKTGIAEVIRSIGRAFGIDSFLVAPDFPVGLAFALKAARVRVAVSEGALFPEREIKSACEIAAIRTGNAASAAGIRAGEQVLREADIKSGFLYLRGRKLTSERLRREVDIACLDRGAVAAHTIVAGGDQACDPHCIGSGPLRANELIILDVFPRVTKTGYFGDMTRTFLKGRASQNQRRLVTTVREAQKAALCSIKAGISGATVHRAVEAFFVAAGFPTRRTETDNEGFFHGTGHGLGLEIHEPPRLGSSGGRLRAGAVTTVEPGLYYRGVGGCRIEDVVAITKTGFEMLSRCHYRWEIR